MIRCNQNTAHLFLYISLNTVSLPCSLLCLGLRTLWSQLVCRTLSSLSSLTRPHLNLFSLFLLPVTPFTVKVNCFPLFLHSLHVVRLIKWRGLLISTSAGLNRDQGCSDSTVSPSHTEDLEFTLLIHLNI